MTNEKLNPRELIENQLHDLKWQAELGRERMALLNADMTKTIQQLDTYEAKIKEYESALVTNFVSML